MFKESSSGMGEELVQNKRIIAKGLKQMGENLEDMHGRLSAKVQTYGHPNVVFLEEYDRWSSPQSTITCEGMPDDCTFKTFFLFPCCRTVRCQGP